ncbi:MAG: hypothetical protein V8S89_04135 [Oscillospiraceae bacterium]
MQQLTQTNASNKTDNRSTPNALSAPEPAKPGRISDAVATLLDIPAAQNASASLEQQVQPAGLAQGLLYEDAAPEIDLSYTACGFDVKEAIIVKAPQAAYRYAFRLTLDGLTPALFGRRGAAVQRSGRGHLRHPRAVSGGRRRGDVGRGGLYAFAPGGRQLSADGHGGRNVDE